MTYFKKKKFSSEKGPFFTFLEPKPQFRKKTMKIEKIPFLK
jgi:hypothetical protein